MNRGCSQALRRWITIAITAFLPAVLCGFAANAGGAVSSALAGAEIAAAPDGIPANPAASVSITASNVQFGVGLPFGEGNVGYLAFYEPRDPRGLGAAYSGMLGVSQQKRAVGIDVQTQKEVYYTSSVVNYQVAGQAGSLGAFGVGARYLQDIDGQTGLTGNAWRLDAGWQRQLGSVVTIGLAAHDVLGSDLRFADNSTVARQVSYQVGMAIKLGTTGYLAADCSKFGAAGKLETWSMGASIDVLPTLTLRGGYRSDAGTGTYSAGAGLHIGKWTVDAASTLGETPAGQISATLVF